MKRLIVLFLTACFGMLGCMAQQDRRVQYKPYVDLRPMHFGILIGAHLQDLEFENVGMQTFTDDDGNVTRFEYMTTIDHEGELYVALMLADEDEEAEEEEGNVVILKIEQDENGEDIYVSIEDEALADAVFQKFLEMVDEADFE